MDTLNGTASLNQKPDALNGTHINGVHESTVEDLEGELPMVYDGQVPLGDLLSRVVQSIYAELSELAETMPNMSDSARKRTLADWVVKTKKQVVKLYAVVKWARDADAVQKCMNITAFLMNQNQQFEDAMGGLNYARESLDPARLRNHDLLTSLDVLTTGSYRRLPSRIKQLIIPPVPLTDGEVLKTFKDVEDVIRYRLRMTEIIPVEMSRHRIGNGRVYFTVPKLFEVSLCLRGGRPDDGWFFVHVEFLIGIGGDLTSTQDFPREPTGIMQRHIADEVNAQLALYLSLPSLPSNEVMPPVEIASRPQLPEGVADAPLIRVFNFLQMMSLSYQLEILWYQAERMRHLGWAEYLNVQMINNRKTLTVSYWIRQPPRPPNRSKLPLLGGTLTISIIESRTLSRFGGGPARSPKARVLADLQQKSKLGAARLSDQAEELMFEVKWEPTKGALGVNIAAEDMVMSQRELVIKSDDLDFESLLSTAIEKHTYAILKVFQFQLQHGPTRSIFSSTGAVTLMHHENIHTLQAHLCADEVVIITIDSRTGRLNLRDSGDLASAGRGPRFTAITEKLNENPSMLLDALVRLRFSTINDLVEQKANSLGLQCFRRRNFPPEELQKLGPEARGMVYVQLSNYPKHYLVIVITDNDFRFALITAKVMSESMYTNLIMEDIAWLDSRRVHGNNVSVTAHPGPEAGPGAKRKRDMNDDVGREKPDPVRFNLETQVLRELYAYCCARVAYMNVEQQFKLRGIPFTHVNPMNGALATSDLGHIQSQLAHSVPALCVQSKHILSGAPAAEAAMPNIRVIPLNWWSEKKAQVVTCVKLKYVQQPMGKTAGTSAIIRPSKRIIYDTTEAVVSFLSENVDTCVDEFLEEWARVSKMVVIAREVAQMSKDKDWNDVRLLSFDLQTVEFAYSADYTVSITCTDQLSLTGGSFDLRFSRSPTLDGQRQANNNLPNHDHDPFNPHDDAEPFLRNILKHGSLLAPSLQRLVALLRDTLPIAVELEEIRKNDKTGIDTFAKAAGWYRLLYGDLRHALDFRLMKDQRVVILDGSHSLFRVASQASAAASGSPAKPSTQRIKPEVDSGSGDASLGLQPIPEFRKMIMETVREVLLSEGARVGKIAPIDVGVVCDVAAVRAVGRGIHSKVVQRLRVEY